MLKNGIHRSQCLTRQQGTAVLSSLVPKSVSCIKLLLTLCLGSCLRSGIKTPWCPEGMREAWCGQTLWHLNLYNLDIAELPQSGVNKARLLLFALIVGQRRAAVLLPGKQREQVDFVKLCA